MKTILEFIANKKPAKPVMQYKYHPKTREELIKNIKTELNAGNEDLNCIDTSDITDMHDLFNYVRDGINIDNLENLDISKWDVSAVKNMHRMFYKCTTFDGKTIEHWDVSNVTDLSKAFQDCNSLNCDLSNWDVSNVKDMSWIFRNCVKFEGKGLENWDVSNVENMRCMFLGCEKFNCDLSGWKVGNVHDMGWMFEGCKTFDCNLTTWDINKYTYILEIFNDCPFMKTQFGITPAIKNGKFVKI